MKIYVFASALLLSTSTLAFAVEPYVSPFIPQAAHDWSGFYFGGHVGTGGSSHNGSYDDDGFTNHDFMRDGGGPFALSGQGVLRGIQSGYNWQSGSIVYGLEGDISFTRWSDSLNNAAPKRTPESLAVETSYIATLRARAGYAWDRTLVYGTLGAAITNTKFSANDDATKTDPAKMGSVNLDKVGVVIGGGVEYALSERWSLKAEGLYFAFNDHRTTYDITNDKDAGNFIKFKDAWSLRLGVNHHF